MGTSISVTLHFHGGPVTPRDELLRLAGRCFCVSFANSNDVKVCHEIGQAVMLDNGAFSIWGRAKKGKSLPSRLRAATEGDWSAYYRWCEEWLEFWTTWAVIPDAIEGSEELNDRLVAEWPFGQRGAPVWHLHESIDRLLRLAEEWPLVCLGSTSDYPIRTDSWRRRMAQAMNKLCGDGPPPCALHMLRGTRLTGGPYPFASVDSTAIARNHMGGHQGFWDPRPRPKRDVVKMANELDAVQCPARWAYVQEQLAMEAA